MRKTLFILSVFLLLNSCESYSVPGYYWVVKVNPGPEFRAELPDGTVYLDENSYRNEMPALVQKVEEEGGFVEVDYSSDAGLLENSLTSSDVAEKESAVELYRNSQVVMTADVKTDNLKGCFDNRRLKHLAVRLNKRFYSPGENYQIYDYHYAVWKENGKFCAGIYESVQLIVNKCLCGDRQYYEQVRNEMLKRMAFMGFITGAIHAFEVYAMPVLEGLGGALAPLGI